MRARYLILGLVLALGMAASGARADEKQRYTVYGGGIKLGSMALDARTGGGKYAASGRVSGGGLLGVFVTFDFAGQATGRIAKDGTLIPKSYVAKSDDGKTARTTKFSYGTKTPRGISFAPPRTPKPYDARPAKQAGTLDPISATLALLQAQPVGKACNKTVDVFDGSKRSRLTLGPRQAARGGKFVCAGIYSRVEGFSPKLMARRVNFPFSVTFVEVDGMMRVDRFSTDTTFGRVVAIRR